MLFLELSLSLSLSDSIHLSPLIAQKSMSLIVIYHRNEDISAYCLDTVALLQPQQKIIAQLPQNKPRFKLPNISFIPLYEAYISIPYQTFMEIRNSILLTEINGTLCRALRFYEARTT